MAKDKAAKRHRTTRQSGKRSPHRQPIEEDIRYRAYEIYLERGARHGHHVDDWLQAERELSVMNRSGGSSSKQLNGSHSGPECWRTECVDAGSRSTAEVASP